jgi:hypothetical protein
VSEAAGASPARRSLFLRLTLSQLWSVVAVSLPAISMLLPKLSAIDLAYQVRAGTLMFHSHRLLRTDPFSFTAGGMPWLNQQWGAELAFAAIYRVGGWALLVVTRALLAALIFLLVFLACRARGAKRKLAAGLAIASFSVSLPGMILRPQLLGLLFFALTVWIISARDRFPRRLLLIPAIVVVWSNVHGSFFLGPALLALAWVEDRSGRSPHPNQTLGVAAVAALAANLNPFGIRVWGYALGIPTNNVISRTIIEWQPPSLRTEAGLLFFLSVAAAIVVLARQRRPAPWPPLLTLGIFFLVGLLAVRGIYWWALVAPSVLAGILAEEDGSAAPEEPSLALNTMIAGMLLMIGFLFLPWWRVSGQPSQANLLDHAPPGVTRALRSAVGTEDRMFNPQIWGSWFEFSVPGLPVFVDSRIEVFPASVWRDYDRVSGGIQGWQAILRRWRITVLVADRTQQAQLIPRIRQDPGWRLVHEDRDGLVFVTRPET